MAVSTVAIASSDGAAAQDGGIDRVVTLGDSYSSGLGIHRDASDYDDHGPARHSFDPATDLGASTCHRELDTTPGARLAADLGADSTVAACAGAVIDEVPNQLDAADIAGTGAGTLVVMTIGGNDIRSGRGENWPDVLIRCITSSRCDRDDRNRIADLDEFTGALTDLYVSIGEALPAAAVRVLGYPRLMQPAWWGCNGVSGVGRSEARFIDGEVDRLNGAIDAAVSAARSATGADLRFVSVVDEFDDHGACRTWQRDRYVNDSLLGETYTRRLAADGTVVDDYDDGWFTVSASSFHPSQKGYDAYGRALADAT